MARTKAKTRREESIDDDPTRRIRESASTAPYGEDAQQRARHMIQQAIRDGSHGPGCGHFCTGCRQLVDAIVWGESGSKTELCAKCYKGIQGSAAVIDAGGYKKAKVGRRYEPTFEDALLWWAKDHFRTAFDAFCQSDERDWEARVLASIVRRRAQDEKGWLNTIIAGKWFAGLLALADKVIRAGGYPMLPGQSFAEAIKRVRECPI